MMATINVAIATANMTSLNLLSFSVLTSFRREVSRRKAASGDPIKFELTPLHSPICRFTSL